MDEILINVSTGLLMALALRSALTLIDAQTLRSRAVPATAIGLSALAVAGILLQHSWSGAMSTLDNDPARSGWWRVITSVFLQNGGIAGDAFNLLTLAAVAAIAGWYWGGPLSVALFLAGAVLPQHIDPILGQGGVSTDPRNFAGSSGATYFLVATLAAALLLERRPVRDRLPALAVPALGLATWFLQDNAHGLVTTYGFAAGAVLWLAVHRIRRPGVPALPAGCGAAEQ